jgi:DNA-binding NtrC family response regulator
MVPPARLLLVDDEDTFLCATAELLRREGYDCRCARDAASAMAMVERERYDLLITDIRMPGNASLEMVDALRRAGNRIPVIVMTGYPSLVSAIRSIDLKVAAYLVKPTDFQELLRRVERALN